MAVALMSAVVVAVTYQAAVVAPWGQVIDTRLMTTTASLVGEPAWARALLDVVSPSSVLVAAAALGAIGLLRGRPIVAACSFGVAIVTPAAASVLKNSLERPSYGVEMVNSLPSGHVAAVAGLAAAAWLVAPPALRATTALLGMGAVAATGLATITLQWHRPSDVVAAIALATAWAAAGALIQERSSAMRRPAHRPRNG